MEFRERINRYRKNMKSTLRGTERYVNHLGREVIGYFRYGFPSCPIIEGPSLTDFIKNQRARVEVKE